MGISCDAHIAFGVLINDDNVELLPFYKEDSEDGIIEDFENWLCAKGGIHKPTEEYNEKNKENKEIYHKYWDAKQDYLKTISYDMDRHGYVDDDECDYILYIKSTHKIAYLGEPQNFNFKELGIDMMNEFDEFTLFLHDLNITDLPDWFLYSYYG